MKRRTRGMAILMVLAISTLLFLLLAILSDQTIFAVRSVGKRDWNDKAYYAAYTGLQYAASRLQEDPYYGNFVDTPDGAQLEPTEFNQDTNYRFVTRVFNNSAGSAAQTVEGNILVPPGKIYVHSDGAYSNSGEDGCITIRAFLESSRPTFKDAILGDSSLKIESGSVIDSTSTSGVTGQTAYSLACNSEELLTGGIKPVQILSGSQSNGSILVRGATPANLVDTSGASSVGASSSLSQGRAVAAYVVPSNLENAPTMNLSTAGGVAVSLAPSPTTGAVRKFSTLNLSFAGAGARGVVSIKPGSYYVDDSVNLDNCDLQVDMSSVPAGLVGNQLQEAKTVFLYVKNSFSMNNSQISSADASFKPRHFQVMMVGTDTTVTGVDGTQHVSSLSVTAGSNAVMTASGYGMTANVQDSVVSGALQAKNANISNSSLHYDEALKNLQLGQQQKTSISGEIFNVQTNSNVALPTLNYNKNLGTEFPAVLTTPSAPSS